MSVLAQLEPRLALANRRYAPRRHLQLGSVVHGSGADAIIHDLSVTGLLLETSGELEIGERLFVEVPEGGPTPATVVWSSGRFFGCEFENAIPASSISAARLRSQGSCPIPGTEEVPPDTLDPIENDYDSSTDDRLSPRARMLVILGLAVLAWALIGFLITWLI